MNKRAEKIFYFVMIFYFVISKSSLNQDEVETSHRRRQHIMNKRAEMMFYFVISKSNQDEVETSHRLYTRQQIMNKRAEKIFFALNERRLGYDKIENLLSSFVHYLLTSSM